MATRADEVRAERPKRGGRGPIVGLLAVLGVVGLAAVAYFAFFRDDSPQRLALSDDPAPGAPAPAAGGPDGRWVVDPSASTLGYRVKETFAKVPAPVDAVGRTSAVEGEMTIDGSTLRAARVAADLTQLKSDQERRDNFLKGRALETERFPRATFTLTEPAELGPEVRQGEPVTVPVRGNLELHGVTKPVEVPLEGRWDGDTVEVVGRVPIAFADYAIGSPTVAGVVSVEDHGEMEMKLVMRRAGSPGAPSSGSPSPGSPSSGSPSPETQPPGY